MWRWNRCLFSSTFLLLVFALFLLFIEGVDGSVGDVQDSYWECTDRCRQSFGCSRRFDTFTWATQPCFRCKYSCMWATEIEFSEKYGYTPQFHGKWPFVAIQLGPLVIQEPASVLFSLLNLCTSYLFWLRLGPYSNLPEKHLWRYYSFVGMITWVSSSIFHCIDCWVTEWMDYFSACAFIFASFSVSAIIALPELSNGKFGSIWRLVIPGFSFFFWLNHVIGLMAHFDYGYNMKVCITMSVLSTLLYARFLLNRYRTNRKLSDGDVMLIRALLLLKGSIVFEMLDFVPIWWLIDAHSLFHLATIPVPLMLHSALQRYAKERFDLKGV